MCAPRLRMFLTRKPLGAPARTAPGRHTSNRGGGEALRAGGQQECMQAGTKAGVGVASKGDQEWVSTLDVPGHVL